MALGYSRSRVSRATATAFRAARTVAAEALYAIFAVFVPVVAGYWRKNLPLVAETVT